MPFVLNCPSCQKAVTIDRDLVGKLVTCPHCSSFFNVATPPLGGVPIAIAASPEKGASNMRRFTFCCQRCGSILEGLGEQCGQPGRCPTCGAVFVVPAVDQRTGSAAAVAVVADDGQFPTPMHAYATAGDRAPKIVRRSDGQQVIVCPRCRREMPIDADGCTACGLPFTLEGATPGAVAISAEAMENNLATAALTVGILSVLSFCLPVLGPVAIGLGIAGIRRAGKLRGAGSGRGMAIAGIILGAAAVVLFTAARLFGM